ncbi:MAG: hypothetical protein NUV97_03430 [archaeon]|nr:hypothetical protein [archaeon]
MVKWKHSKIKQTIIAIVIALITVFFLAYLIQTIYPSPEYEDFCEERLTFKAIETQIECESNGGMWSDYGERPVPEKTPLGWCDTEYQCRQDYEDAIKPYERNVFFANLLFGLVIFILAFFFIVEAISVGFMGGGAILMIYGTIRYWGNLSNVFRTIFLGIALAIIVYFSYKKLK